MSIPLPSDTTITQMTKVLEGDHNVINTILQFVSNTKLRIDACIDHSRPSLAIDIEELKKAFLDAKSRGVKLRYVTEITKDNVIYCKELIKMVNELRHIDGIKGNFYISEREYIAPATFHVKEKTASHIVYSNVKQIIEFHQTYIFEVFWNRSTPAEQRINGIEAVTKKD